MGREKIDHRRGRRILAWGALACALAALSARAEVCPALLEKIEVSPAIQGFLADPRVLGRVVSYGEGGDAAFRAFYDEIQSWLVLEKGVGRSSRGKATLRTPGGEPLLRVLKRDKYRIQAKLEVIKAGEIDVEFDLDAARTTAPAAILDLETLQIAVVNKLFADFKDPAELRRITVGWKLGRDAPRGFGEHLLSLGFEKKSISRCSLAGGVVLALGSTGVGAAAGGFLSIPADDAIYSGSDPHGHIASWATLGGLGMGSLTYFVCRKPSSRGGRYELAFARILEP